MFSYGAGRLASRPGLALGGVDMWIPVVAWHIAPVSAVTSRSHSRFSSCTTDAQEMRVTGAEPWISTLKADDISLDISLFRL